MSRKQEWTSRVIFYGCAIATLWVMGRVAPTSAEIEKSHDEQIGASQIVIILPDR